MATVEVGGGRQRKKKKKKIYSGEREERKYKRESSRLPEVTTLGRRRGRYVVRWPERAIPGCRDVSDDHFSSGFVSSTKN